MSNESFSNHKSLVESASSSMKQAQIERWSGMMEDSLAHFYENSGSWDALYRQIRQDRGENQSEQQKSDIGVTIKIMQDYMSSNDKLSVLKNAVKQLPEIARALRSFGPYSHNVGELDLYVGALQRLEKAVGEFATEEEAYAAREAMGLMSDEEVQNAKEMISQMTINGNSETKSQ